MLNSEFEDFVRLAAKEKSRRHLHTLAQEKLELYLSHLYPRDCIVPEVSGILGGRNDLMLFACNGRRVVFEFFFSPSQVPQDLRLLELAKADAKIAILLDHEVNPKLAIEYFRKKPDHFPFLWLSHLMVPSQEKQCLALLRELLDEKTPGLSLLLEVIELTAGTLAQGKYELVGAEASMTKAARELAQKIPRISKGNIFASFTLDTADRSASSEIAGNITVQY